MSSSRPDYMIPNVMRTLLAAALAIVVLGLSAFVASAQRAPALRPGSGQVAFQIEEATIDRIQQALRSRRLTTVALVEAYLRRIRAYNGPCVNQPEGLLGPITTIRNAGQINALATLNLRPAARRAWGFDERKARSLTDPADAAAAMPDALETAAAQDRRLRETGRLTGPLHGVVLAVKDQYDTFDMRTTSGADAQYANDRPPDDATFVRRLREAGAIILAKANLAEYAVDGARSSFGGTFCNPYDTEREPGMSSAGSATAVAANLVTCAIGEETVVSIRWPAAVNSLVGIAPTQELVSRDGMIGAGLNMRTGPICRTVQDAARVLDVIAGYDPKDEMTVHSVGRLPARAYATFAGARRLDGVRIGVVREYLNRTLLARADEESITLVERAIADLRGLGASIVDPGPGGALFQGCLVRAAPELLNAQFTRRYPQAFPADAAGAPAADHIGALLDMRADPARVPSDFSLRTLGGAGPVGLGSVGEDRYMINRYLRERGDAAVRSNADLIARATFYRDANFPDRRQARENAERARALDTSISASSRVALQTVLLQCMQEQRLDALVAPMSTVPPRKLTAPREPAVNGRTPIGWSLIGQQGFPAITVPAGFTSQVWDRVRAADGSTPLEGPVAARLPVGVDFIARPFDEPMLLRIASAYEAATRHRRPPEGFGPPAPSLVEGVAQSAPRPGSGQAADLILHNARIYTADARNTVAEAVAIRGDRIVRVGLSADVLGLRGPATRVVDAQGAAVVPGLQDAHGHVTGLGATLLTIDLRGTTSYQQIVERVRERVATARPGEWIVGRNWDQNDWVRKDWPSHGPLSAVSPQNPVYLTRVDGHAALVNRRALESAGLTRDTRDPDGGRIIREAAGAPAGVLVDTAMGLVSSKIPPLTDAQVEAQILRADEELRRLGLTMVHDAGTNAQTVNAYKRLVDAGRLKTRVHVMLRGPLASLAPFFTQGPLTDYGNHRLAVRAIKISADGALGSRGAALLEPYADEPGTSGLLTTPPDEVYAQTLAASKAGFQTCVHAIGDRANRIVLDIFERVQKEVPAARALRLRVEHAQILDAAEIPRFARLGVIASMQPTHATSDMPWAADRIGRARVEEGAYRWQTLLESGVRIPAGSDFPVEEPNPLLGLYAAITRQDPSGNPPGGWTAAERMTREQALRAFTIDAAYAAHAETLTGSIEAGKLADLVMLSADIMRVPAQEIPRTTVRMTVVGGEVVYEPGGNR